jgi:hypothetical protein
MPEAFAIRLTVCLGDTWLPPLLSALWSLGTANRFGERIERIQAAQSYKPH